MALRTEIASRPPMAGLKCLFESNIADICHFIFEVPTSVVQAHIPRGIVPVEPRPGIALLDVGYVSWAAGNREVHWPTFDEVTLLLLVHPDLSFPMPMPKFSFFTLNIYSNYQEFLDTEPRFLRLPSKLSRLAPKFTGDPYTVAMDDAAGPMFRLRNTHPAATYEPVDFVGQYFSVEEGTLYMGIWQWEGDAAEHQVSGDAGELFDHPLYRGMNVRPYRQPYLQIFARPGAGSIQRFYEPFAIGPAVYDHPRPRE